MERDGHREQRERGGQPEGGKRAGTRRREIGGTGRSERDGHREQRERGGQPEGGKRAGTRRREIGGTGRSERDGHRAEGKRWAPGGGKEVGTESGEKRKGWNKM